MAIDNPMWSVATEWQIYFLFPFVLLPLWRHAGLAAAVIGGFAVGLLPVLLLPSGTDFDTWCPWMLGDFAVGMAAASIAFAPPERIVSKGMKIWGLAAAMVVAGIALLQIRFPQLWHAMEEWQKDVLTGAAVGLLLVYLARCQLKCTRPPLLFRMLDSRLPIALGAFSYSLYLVHFPIISVLDIFVGHLSHNAKVQVLTMYVIGTALSLICGYAFYRVFERPFISARPRPASTAKDSPILASPKTELTAALGPI
jgi:peptidoglycan/LPS O-acetylase OafA/YrhL